jgi:hypothetical protein
MWKQYIPPKCCNNLQGYMLSHSKLTTFTEWCFLRKIVKVNWCFWSVEYQWSTHTVVSVKMYWNHVIFLECAVALTRPYYKYHYTHNTTPRRSEEYWRHGGSEGETLMGCSFISRVGKQWRGRRTRTQTRAEFYQSSCWFHVYTMPFFYAQNIGEHD